MPREAPVMTATFLALLIFVSFILSPHSPQACKIILDARDSGLSAGLVLVATRRTRDTKRTDHFTFGLDRDRAGERQDVGERRDHGTVWISVHTLANPTPTAEPQ